MENNVIFNNTCWEVHVTLACVEASQDSALKRIFMAVCACMLVCDVVLHTRKSVLGIVRAHSAACTMDNSSYLHASPKAHFARLLQFPVVLSDLSLRDFHNQIQNVVAVACRLGPHKITVGADVWVVTASFGWNKVLACLRSKPHLLCTRADVPGSL